jgi:hypothetical protein
LEKNSQWQPEGDETDMKPNEWAEKAFQQIERQKEKRLLEIKGQLHEAELRKSRGPRLWEEIIAALKDRVAALNAKCPSPILFIHEIKHAEITVKTSDWLNVPGVTLSFDPSCEELKCDWHNSETRYTLKVRPGNEVCFVERSGVPSSVDMVVEQALGHIIEHLDS